MGEAGSGVAYTTFEMKVSIITKKGFLSASDRRWKERYARIQEKKESESFYLDMKREEKKRKPKCVRYYSGKPPLDLSVLEGQDKVAVVCNSTEEIKRLLQAVRAQYPSKIHPLYTDDYYIQYHVIAFDLKLNTLGFFEIGWPAVFENEGYKLVTIDELIAVCDLGDFESDNSIEMLLSI